MSPFDDLKRRAMEAVQDNLRHSRDSLWNLLSNEFKNATDEQIDMAIEQALFQ